MFQVRNFSPPVVFDNGFLFLSFIVPCGPHLDVDGGLSGRRYPQGIAEVNIESGQWPCLSEFASGISHNPDILDGSSRTFHASKATVTSSRLQRVQNIPRIFRTSSFSDPFAGEHEPLEMADVVQDSGSGVLQVATIDASTPKELVDGISTKDRMALFWDKFDSDGESVSSVPFRDFRDALVLPSPRRCKLRKQRSSAMSQRFSIISTSTSTNKLRKKLRPMSTALFTQSDPPSVELPTGIEQIGSGIGYIYNMPTAAHSKASICTTTPRTCHGMFHGGFPALGLGLGLHGIRKGKAKRCALDQEFGTQISNVSGKQEEPEDAVFMRNIYGSSWSLGLSLSPTVNHASPIAHTPANSPISDAGPLTPETIIFRTPEAILNFKESEVMTTREAKSDDPTTTLRLVSPAGLRQPFSPTMATGFPAVHCHPFAILE